MLAESPYGPGSAHLGHQERVPPPRSGMRAGASTNVEVGALARTLTALAPCRDRQRRGPR
eukprot:5925094-Heterocapsa_arctica.AAC.2